MKINSKQLRKMILQEMHDMRHSHSDHGHDHYELMDAVMHAAGGCPIRARAMLQTMLHRIEPMAHEREMQMQRDVPNPATSGVIPSGEELMGDDMRMEDKKVTAYRGAGGMMSILGPGFR